MSQSSKRKRRRDKKGRFICSQVDSKGYLVVKAGPQRDVRVHTLVAQAMLGRKLRPDEEVHHKNLNKLDCAWTNLKVLGKAEHTAVTAKQAWYFRTHDIAAKKEWDKYFDEEEDVSFP